MKNFFNLLVALVMLSLAGCGLSKFFDKPDGIVEEMAESIVEDGLEELLDLPNNSLDGKIDFTPGSEED